MTKKQIGIFGGSFDPCHIGHIEVAEKVLDAFDNNSVQTLDEVWLMPCNVSLYDKELESGEKRVGMCKVATRNNDRIKVCDWEIKHNMQGSTFELMDMLSADPEFEDCEFSFIIGYDNALKFETWVNWEYLRDTYRFIVVPRQGYENEKNAEYMMWYMHPPHVYIATAAPADISSTQLREAFYNKKKFNFVNENMDPEVLEYILFNSMYISNIKSGDMSRYFKESHKAFNRKRGK